MFDAVRRTAPPRDTFQVAELAPKCHFVAVSPRDSLTFAMRNPVNFSAERFSMRVCDDRDSLLVLLIALALRLLVLWTAVAQHGATWLYTRGVEIGFVTNSLLEGHGFSSPFGGHTGPTALIAPGYPILVAAVFQVFGASTAASAVVIMLGQIVLNLATIALMMHLARRISSRQTALLTGLFWACWPPLLWMPTIFWETSFSAFLLVGILAFALEMHERSTTFLWLAFGFACGCAALMNMALIITLAGVFVWLTAYSKHKQWRGIALAVCVALLVYSPWPIRNARVFHAFVPLRTTVGLELRMGNHDGSSGYLEESMFPLYNSGELAAYIRHGELAYDHQKLAEARAWVSAHPWTFIRLSTVRAIRYWSGSGTRNGSPIFIAGAVLTSLAGFAALYGLYCRGQTRLALLFSIPLLCFPLPYYMTHAEFRYRLVLDPLLTILSAHCLTAIVRRKSATVSLRRELSVDQPREWLAG